jgi:hypothetical protein
MVALAAVPVRAQVFMTQHEALDLAFPGARVDPIAVVLTPEEKAAVWPRLLEVWPTYDSYVERSGREIRVFRLEPVSS